MVTLMEMMEVDVDDGENRTLQKYICLQKFFYRAGARQAESGVVAGGKRALVSKSKQRN